MAADFAIRARNLGKCYQIYNQPIDRLKQSLWRGRKQFYREFWALREVSIEIKKGETVGIIGSNGSGKSTLLQLICGVLYPTEGEVEINGRIAALLELGAGFNPEFTGRENVYMNAAIMGLSRAETDARFDDIVAFADIGNFLDQPVKTYSSGMYVRLAFATAVNVSADILVVDEALAVGDARFQQKCMAKIREFCRSGTVIFVSHDTTAVTELCSRVLWIESGRVKMDGEPKLVVEKYLEHMYGEGSRTEKELLETSSISGNNYNLNNFIPVTNDIRQFGNRKVVIESVRLLSPRGSNGVVYSGRKCEISLILHARERISKPIVGYTVKDRLGREIFGDNTALIKYPLSPLAAGKRYLITFKLDAWPNLVEGDYAISAAVAEGTMEDHVQCHWLHDVFIVKSIPVRSLPSVIFSILNTEVTFSPMDG